MTRWLLVSAAVLVGQIILGYFIGGVLRRRSPDIGLSEERSRPRVLTFYRPALRRFSGHRRVVGH